MSLLQANKMWGVILSLLALTPVGLAYPSGAPAQACLDMTPQHGPSEQSSTPPYELVVSNTTYAGGDEIQVTLSRTGNSATFRGFFIQARTVGSTDAQGRFTSLDSGTTKTVNCGSEANSENGVTHTGRTDKSSVTVTWTAPANRVGHIQFRATVVETEQVFWVSGVRSDYVQDPTAGPLPTPATSGGQDIGVTSSGCGSTKGCYQSPTACAPPACDYFSSWQTSGNNILFEVSGRSPGFLAVGISEDETMTRRARREPALRVAVPRTTCPGLVRTTVLLSTSDNRPPKRCPDRRAWRYVAPLPSLNQGYIKKLQYHVP